MLKQGVLPFSYEGEPTESGMTALAGLPAYLELAIVSGLTDSMAVWPSSWSHASC